MTLWLTPFWSVKDTRSNGNTNLSLSLSLSLSQSGSIIHAVTGHRHEPAFLLKPLDLIALVLREHLRDDIIDACFRATASAVVRLSPVNITIRTPSSRNLRTALRSRILDGILHAN